MKHALLPLLLLVAAGSLAKADTLNYEYTWHIDGVTLPGDGLRLPSITLAFLASDDLRFGDPAEYFFGDPAKINVVPLYLHESVSPNSPTYLNPFVELSGFFVGRGGEGLWIGDHLFMGDNAVSYDTYDLGVSVVVPGPGQTVAGTILGISSTFHYSDDSPELARTHYTLSLSGVPEPGAASLLALGLVGIAGLALWRRRRAGEEL